MQMQGFVCWLSGSQWLMAYTVYSYWLSQGANDMMHNQDGLLIKGVNIHCSVHFLELQVLTSMNISPSCDDPCFILSDTLPLIDWLIDRLIGYVMRKITETLLETGSSIIIDLASRFTWISPWQVFSVLAVITEWMDRSMCLLVRHKMKEEYPIVCSR